MLDDKGILAALDKKLENHPKDFNIQIFLCLLQNTTRPLGYPDYHYGPNKNYYLDLIKKNIDNAHELKNGSALSSLKRSLSLVMICFAYFHDNFYIKNELDLDLIDLLYVAIDKRIETTDEERCAEMSLLLMLLERPSEVIQLIGAHHKQLISVDISKLNCDTQQLKQKINVDGGIAQKLGSKKFCQTTIGLYLLDHVDNVFDQDWIKNNPFLSEATVLGLKEQGKKEATNYINNYNPSQNTSFLCIFSFFSKQHPTRVLLSAADKLLQSLNNKKTTFTQEEQEALQDDTDHDLTSIYNRYKQIVYQHA